MNDSPILDSGILESMGISQAALEEIQKIIGRMPTIEELSDLLAMWESNGRQQSLYGWLKGQHNTVERQEYLYDGTDTTHKDIREPRVKDCIDIARNIIRCDNCAAAEPHNLFDRHGDLIYMVGDVSTAFLDSEYARKYLHIASEPIKMPSAKEDEEYIDMILTALRDNNMIKSMLQVSDGGIFQALATATAGRCGFDILTCREVRLDAFLFGEEAVRFVISLSEDNDDRYLLKMDEARLNCCFLGRVTKGRVLVDGTDFGDISEYYRADTVKSPSSH